MKNIVKELILFCLPILTGMLVGGFFMIAHSIRVGAYIATATWMIGFMISWPTIVDLSLAAKQN
jgi:hypothetical protein